MSALLDDNNIILTDAQLETIEQLKKLIRTDYPNINIQQDLNFLTKFLNANDWNVVETINKIVYSYRLKKDYPAWFATKKVSDYWPIIQTHSRYMLNERDKNGKRIFVYKCEKFNTPEMNLKMSAQLDDMWYDAMLMDLSTQCNGITVIADCKNFPKALIKWLIPKEIKVSTERANIFPCKNLQIHLVNTPSLISVVAKVIMPLLNDKVKAKIHFHQNDWTLLHTLVGRDCLPEEYGGPVGKTVDYESSYRFLLAKEAILLENMKYGIV